jgi:hypothetical protein
LSSVGCNIIFQIRGYPRNSPPAEGILHNLISIRGLYVVARGRVPRAGRGGECALRLSEFPLYLFMRSESCVTSPHKLVPVPGPGYIDSMTAQCLHAIWRIQKRFSLQYMPPVSAASGRGVWIAWHDGRHRAHVRTTGQCDKSRFKKILRDCMACHFSQPDCANRLSLSARLRCYQGRTGYCAYRVCAY